MPMADLKIGATAKILPGRFTDGLQGTTVTILGIENYELSAGVPVNVRYEDNGFEGIEGVIPSTALEVIEKTK